MDSVKVPCLPPADSLTVREPPKPRKKALISIQIESSAIPEIIVYRGPIPKPVIAVAKVKATPPAPLPFVDDDESSLFEYDGSSDGGQSSASSDYEPHAKMEAKKRTRRMACPICGQKFLRKNAFKQHQFRMHQLLPIACEEEGCKERFATLSELFKHRRIHDPETRFPCQQCSRVFTTSHARKVHARIHVRRRWFKCDLCEMTFKAITHLHRHFRKEHPKRSSKTPREIKPKLFAEPSVKIRCDPIILEGRFRAIVPKPPPSETLVKTGLPSRPLLKPKPVSTEPSVVKPTNTTPSNINEVVDAPSSQMCAAPTYLPIYASTNLSPSNGASVANQLFTFPDGLAETANNQPPDSHPIFYSEAGLPYQLPDFGVEAGDISVLQSSFNCSFAPIEIVDLNVASMSADNSESSIILDSFAASYTWSPSDSLVYATDTSAATAHEAVVSYYSYISQPPDGQAYAWLQPNTVDQSQVFAAPDLDRSTPAKDLTSSSTSFSAEMLLPSNT